MNNNSVTYLVIKYLLYNNINLNKDFILNSKKIKKKMDSK